MRGFQEGCALTREAELRSFCPWSKQVPSLLWRNKTKGLGGAQCQPWDMVFLGLHLLAGDGDVHPLAPLELGHWAWAMLSLYFTGFGWRGTQDFLAFTAVQVQHSLDKFHFYFCFSSFGGIVADFSSMTLFIYFVCINMQRTVPSYQFSPLITWVPGTELRLSIRFSGKVLYLPNHFTSLFLLLLLGCFFFYDYECFALMYICVTHVSLLSTKVRRSRNIRFPGTRATKGHEPPCGC